MDILAAAYQFEIRFTRILNFSNVINTSLSPFVAIASNINVENENTKDVRYTLDFAEAQYKIIIAWDRLVIRYEGKIESLCEANSPIEEPFFNLYDRITSLEEFGKTTDYLLYALMINKMEGNKADLLAAFMSKYYQAEKIKSILSEPTDLAIIIDKKLKDDYTQVIHGPYLGLDDLNARKAFPNYINPDKFDGLGEMAEIKIFRKADKMNFSTFKLIFKESNQILNKLWPKN